MNTWTTKDGRTIMVKDMELSYVENVLQMLINKYTLVCLNYGARFIPGISMRHLTEEEKRDMLDRTCADRRYLKEIVIRRCFKDDPEIIKKILGD